MDQGGRTGAGEVDIGQLEAASAWQRINSHYITKYTLDCMTEPDYKHYNKISVSRVQSMGNYSILKTIIENRGTPFPRSLRSI